VRHTPWVVSGSVLLAALGACASRHAAESAEFDRVLRVMPTATFAESIAAETAESIDGGGLRLRAGFVETAQSYSAPFDVTVGIFARGGEPVRMRFGATALVWNDGVGLRVEGGPADGASVASGGSLPRDRAVELRVVVHPEGIAAYADGAYLADWTGDFRDAAPVRIESSGTLDVRSLVVTPRTNGVPFLECLDPVTQLARGVDAQGRRPGLHVAGEVDPRKGDAVDVVAPFDLRGDWRLEFSMIPGSVDQWGQMLFVWGDRRAGRDTIWVRQRARGLEAGTWAKPDSYLVAMLPESTEPRWVVVTLAYDAQRKRMTLAFDGRVVAESPTGEATFDRPMPACVGQAFGGDQLFTGRVRDVVLENR
jgi:hypothetical protein